MDGGGVQLKAFDEHDNAIDQWFVILVTKENHVVISDGKRGARIDGVSLQLL
jgi:hypothetical protein